MKYMSYLEIQKETEDRLRNTDLQAYCYRVCTKIGYYVQQMYHKEIMKMGCDFYQDDNGKVWFFYAKNILTRRLPSAPEVS